MAAAELAPNLAADPEKPLCRFCGKRALVRSPEDLELCDRVNGELVSHLCARPK